VGNPTRVHGEGWSQAVRAGGPGWGAALEEAETHTTEVEREHMGRLEGGLDPMLSYCRPDRPAASVVEELGWELGGSSSQADAAMGRGSEPSEAVASEAVASEIVEREAVAPEEVASGVIASEVSASGIAEREAAALVAAALVAAASEVGASVAAGNNSGYMHIDHLERCSDTLLAKSLLANSPAATMIRVGSVDDTPARRDSAVAAAACTACRSPAPPPQRSSSETSPSSRNP
jgi:hypothetical protein